jgi:hypothetical protein
MKNSLLWLSVVGLAGGGAHGQSSWLVDYFGPDGNLVKVMLTSPPEEMVVGPTTPFLADAEFGPDNTLYALPLSGTAFYQIDTATVAVTQIGTSIPLSGHNWSGLAYDNTTGILFASSTSGSGSAFYWIEISTGAASLIGATAAAKGVVDIAFDGSGQMYAHNLPDEIYQIDKATGVAAYLGDTGFMGAGPWHGLDYCYENGTMYMATYNSITMERSFRSVNLSSGLTTLVGTTTLGAGGFAIVSPPSAVSGESVSLLSPPSIRVSQNPAHGEVCFLVEQPVQPGCRVEILDLYGRIVRSFDLGHSPAAPVHVVWDCRDSGGVMTGSGVYVAMLIGASSEDPALTASVRFVRLM